jgi:chromate transporter
MATPPNFAASQESPLARPSFAEAFRFWLKLGLISFGGPSGQIAIMHAELVERKRWIDEVRFLHALNFCMLLPGPEAQQLAIYIGWLLHRVRGGIAAGTLFVIPSAILLWALSYIYVAFGDVPSVAAIFYGLKPAVVAIVAAAVIRIGQRALRRPVMWFTAVAAFLALYFGHAPFPLVIVGAGLLGLAVARLGLADRADVTPGTVVRADAAHLSEPSPTVGRVARVCAIGLLVWWLPILLAGIVFGTEHTIFREGIFFSKAALVTFGGAYAVLPYVSQQAVEHYHWLTGPQMLDGLGLAETTPGPLIMVLQFVGFVGAWNHPGQLAPWVAATLGAFITTWATFTPCFLWIFLGAPYVEKLRDNRLLTAALSTVTAAVVGVILNLAVWFGLHALFPSWRVDWFAVGVSLLAFIGILRWKWNVIPVVIGSGVLGLIYTLAGFR